MQLGTPLHRFFLPCRMGLPPILSSQLAWTDGGQIEAGDMSSHAGKQPRYVCVLHVYTYSEKRPGFKEDNSAR